MVMVGDWWSILPAETLLTHSFPLTQSSSAYGRNCTWACVFHTHGFLIQNISTSIRISVLGNFADKASSHTFYGYQSVLQSWWSRYENWETSRMEYMNTKEISYPADSAFSHPLYWADFMASQWRITITTPRQGPFHNIIFQQGPSLYNAPFTFVIGHSSPLFTPRVGEAVCPNSNPPLPNNYFRSAKIRKINQRSERCHWHDWVCQQRLVISNSIQLNWWLEQLSLDN